MKLFILLIVLVLIGCSFGPFEITHKEGHLPKLSLNISDNCKVRTKGGIKADEIHYKCEWDVDL